VSPRPRTIPGDWFDGSIPENAQIQEGGYIESSCSFVTYRSRMPVGLELGRGAAIYCGTVFDTGESAQIRIGDYSLLNGAWISCESEIEIGSHCLLSWGVVIMDSRRAPETPAARKRQLIIAATAHEWAPQGEAQPVHIASNVWLGFDVCVLPGVTIGEGSIVAARSVVFQDVPAYCVAAGNPASVVRALNEKPERQHA
jgi:acetyltransferase-like isoleucine patch superfamily enzyme